MSMGTGFEGGIGRGLAIHNNLVYACGDFVVAGGTRANFAAVWDGQSWYANSKSNFNIFILDSN
jgi:hypothetical protein